MKRRVTKKLIIIVALFLIALCYFIYIFTKKEPLTYVTVQGQYRDISSQVYATGVLAGQVEVDIGAQVSGQIKKIYVKRGDVVKAGDLLCEIDPEIQENNLKTAIAQEKLITAQIAAKKAQLEYLKNENLRQQKLLKSKATSTYEAESAKSAYLVAKYELEALNAQLEQAHLSVSDAKTNLSYTQITAPMDGTIYAIPVEEGQTVNANQTTPTLLKMAKLDVMTVEAEISEADVVKVKEGMECSFTILGLRNKQFVTTLKSIDPAPSSAEDTTTSTSSSSDSNAIYYNALLDIDNKDNLLRIDMTANVTITTAKKEHAFVIPVTTLRNDDYGTHASVYVLNKDNTVTEKEIEIGIRDSLYVEVVSGLNENDLIVLGDDVATLEAQAMESLNNRKRPPRSI